jgi:hypothetical protein
MKEGNMRIQSSLKIAAATMASVGLIAGFGVAGVASASPYRHSNHHRDDGVTVVDSGNTVATNNTAVKLRNNVSQYAETGEATVENESRDNHGRSYHHDNHGNSGSASATTGSASNASTASAAVTLQSRAATPAAMPQPPDDAKVIHSGNTTLTNNTRVGVNNTITQTAVSGDATVEGNVSAGSATTGAATNNSTASFTVSVSN